MCGSGNQGEPNDQITNLRLNENNIQGNFPDISGMHELISLHLEGNSLVCGTCGAFGLPTTIAGAAKLRNLFVQNNQLAGQLPPALGGLPLEHFDGSFNDFTSWPSATNGWANLGAIIMSDNELTSFPMTDSGFYGLRNLETMDVANNRITDIPNDISNIASLIHLDVSGNKLKTLPTTIGDMDALTYINANDNEMTYVPTGVSGMAALQFLYMDDNEIATVDHITFPNTLQTLSIAQNKLTAFPAGVNLPELETLILKDNAITTMPSATLPILNSLDLTDNGITHIDNALLAGTTRLQTLLVGMNQLTALPPINHNTQLLKLDASSNQLTHAPDLSGTSVNHLELQRNGLHTIPVGVWTDTALMYMDLSYNQLTQLPDEIGDLVHMITLKADNNRITDVSDSLLNMKALVHLDLSFNSLQQMTAGLSLAASLETLNLAYNQFDHLPVNLLETLTNLRTLDISGNPFEASGFPELQTLGFLNELKCRHCHLYDTTLKEEFQHMPQWIAKLDLSHNELSGHIPSHLKALISSNVIEELILNDNWLHGWVPEELNIPEGPNRPVVDLSNNEFFCPIPSWAEWTGLSDDDCHQITTDQVRAVGRPSVQQPATMTFQGSGYVKSSSYQCAFYHVNKPSHIDPTVGVYVDERTVTCPSPTVELGRPIVPGELTIALIYDNKPLSMPHEFNIIDQCSVFKNDCGGCTANTDCLYCPSTGMCSDKGLTQTLTCSKWESNCGTSTGIGSLLFHWAWMILLLIILLLVVACMVSLCIIKFRPKPKQAKGKPFIENIGDVERQSLLINEFADEKYEELA